MLLPRPSLFVPLHAEGDDEEFDEEDFDEEFDDDFEEIDDDLTELERELAEEEGGEGKDVDEDIAFDDEEE